MLLLTPTWVGEMDGSRTGPAGTASGAGPLAAPGTFLLVGETTGHSPTPSIWTALFRAAGLPWRFEARDVAEHELGSVFAGIREGVLPGALVTMPYKPHAALAADRCDGEVEQSGVANLLVGESGELVASNTDVAAVRQLTAEHRFTHAVILGSGGAARAAMTGLYGKCARLTVASIDDEGAAELVRRSRGGFESVDAVSWRDRAAIAREADLVVNATPLGMVGRDDDTPLPGRSMSSRTWMYDFVYRPDGAMTPLQSVALWAEAQVSDGLAHLQAQTITALAVLGLDPDLASVVSERIQAAVHRRPMSWGDR